MAASLETSSSSVRARRRPARYSPELPQSEMSNGVLEEGQEEEVIPSAVATVVYNGHPEMAPAASNRGPGRPPSKHKKRKSSSASGANKKRSVVEDAAQKRPRVANVLLENETLIEEIKKRKALWQRTHEQHHSSVLTTPYWDEVATACDLTPDNVRKRWKSLKDHYRRELKKSMTDPTAPPSIWPYYRLMKFMKSQMFVSLRRKNGEDHLEILSDEEEEVNNQWNGTQHHQKIEGADSDTMDGYEMGEDYNEAIKYEMHVRELANHNTNGSLTQEEEEEMQQQEEENQEEQQQEGELPLLSPIATLQEQEELAAAMQQQSEMPTITTIADMTGNVNIPTIVTTTATSLSGRLSSMQHQRDISGRISAMQQQHADEIQRSNSLSALQQQNLNINENISDPRHTVLQQQSHINSRISAIQRNVGMNILQQNANTAAIHNTAEMSTLQHRANMSAMRRSREMQQRNGVVENGVDSSNDVSPIDERGEISDDYHFFMSLLPHIRHFNSLQKLKVRNRIHQVIIEEASNIQYDPLGNC